MGVGNLTLPGWGGEFELEVKGLKYHFFGQRLSNASGCFRTWSHLRGGYRFCE